VLLVVGTSATVAPASSIPIRAKEHGCVVIEINPEPTPLSERVDLHVAMGASEAMTRILAVVDELEQQQQQTT
jgi:NAD-dependent deacetylase